MVGTAPSDLGTTRTIFYAVAVLMAIYGLGLLLFPHAIFTLSDDPGAVPANPGRVRWGGGFVLGTAVAAWLCWQQAREPTASHDGVSHSLHLGHPGFALQQPRWRLPWSAVVELVADIGQRCPGGRDVVANIQICRVDKVFCCQKSAKAKSQAPSATSARTITVASRVSSVSTLRARRWCGSERWAMGHSLSAVPIPL